MGERDIDKYFKDQLKGYSKDVDTDAIWSALDLEENKKRPYFIWVSGFILIMFIGVIYYGTDKFSTQDKIPSKDAVVILDNSDRLISQPKANSRNKSEAVTEINLSSKQIQKSLVEKIILDKSIKYDGIVKLIKPTSTKSDTKANTSIKLSETNVKKEIGYGNVNKNVIREANISPTVSLEIETKQDDRFKNVTDHSAQLLAPNTQRLSLQFKTLGINNAEIFSIPERTKIELNHKTIEKSISNSSRGLSLNIYSGIYKLNRTLTAHNVQLEPFLSKKENSESPLELISIGTQLKYDLGAVYFKAGIEFQSLNEKFEYQERDVLDTLSSQGIVGILIDSEGNSIYQEGTVFEESTLTSRWVNYNSHRLFIIPLSIGYEKQISSWFLSVEAQTSLNFRRSFSGKQLDRNNNITKDSETIDESFKLGLGVSVGLRYAFTNTTSVYIRPHYFRYNNSFDKEMINYSQKYDMFGMQLGMSFKLF